MKGERALTGKFTNQRLRPQADRATLLGLTQGLGSGAGEGGVWGIVSRDK
jgi:hypothetical protein